MIRIRTASVTQIVLRTWRMSSTRMELRCLRRRITSICLYSRVETTNRPSGVMTHESTNLGDAHGDWYFCFKHNTVEPRDGCSPSDRMGPYPTPEDALNWKERVAERNKEWDADDD